MSERERESAPQDVAADPVKEAGAPAIGSLLRGDLQGAVRSGHPLDPAKAAQLRRLQRSAGNAAVVQMLRQVAPPAAEAAAGPASAGGLIVADEGQEPAAGQMRRGEFLDEVHGRASAAATSELGMIFTLAGCPWLDHWTDYYRTRTPAEIEAAIRRYAPAAAGATTVAQYLAAIEQRVADGIRVWRDTGKIPPAPTVEGAPGAPAGGGAGAASVARSPSLLEEPGTPLDSEVGARIGSAFGRDFSSVRIHAGTPAAGIAQRMSARAVTVGRHVAFAPGEYEPGTPLGNALIAHELAHVVQQEGGGVARTPATAALEADADTAAGAALLASYAPNATLARRVVPALRTGLTLQSCPGETATAATFEDHIRAGRYDRAAALLATERDDDRAFGKLRRLTRAQRTSLDRAAAALGASGAKLRRLIAFAQMTAVTVDDPGEVATTAEAGGGTVEGRLGAGFTTPDGRTYDDAFTLTYQGPEAGTTRWLQFIWREMVCEHPTRGTYPVRGPFESSAATDYAWTEDPTAPVYNTDTASTTNPFYEAAGAAGRTADSTTILDMPSAAQGQARTEFARGATRVTSRAHYITYLVRANTTVLQVVNTDVEWVFNSATDTPRRHQTQRTAAASALDPAMRTRLLAGYPTFSTIP